MINIQNIAKQYGEKVLFENVSVALSETARTSLVGVNGSGKTTLLRILSGTESPDKGSITKPDNLTIGYLPQEIESVDNKSPLDIILEPFQHLIDYEKTLAQLSDQLESSTDNKVLKQMDDLHQSMHHHDGFALQSKAESILMGLGVPKANWNLPIQSLSGGYRMRTVLGKILLSAPDFLLLDEPTNHLDIDSLVWLERFLQSYKGGMLIVSHDRDFLNRITTTTSEISRNSITLYKGNYDAYLVARNEARIAEESRVRNLQTQIDHVEKFVERFKAKASKATQAQSRAKQLEALKAEMPVLASEEKSIHFSFPIPKPSGTIPLDLKSVTAGYNGVPVFSDVSFQVRKGDKIAIVGPNGAGKSTILKVLAGHLAPIGGSFEIGYNTMVRYFGQHQLEQLDPSKTLLDTVAAQSISSEKTYIRNVLGAFLFSGDSVDKRVGVLSGGEKSRLVLASILASPGNTLLLDEPTNHLDMQSVDMLASAMASFEGTIVFVSHDEYFINKIANRIIEVRPGLIRDFPGTLQSYREYVEYGQNDSSQITPAKSESSNTDISGISDKESRIRSREQRKKLTRTIDKLEKEIEQLEASITDNHAVLNNPINGTNFSLLQETNQQLELNRATLNSIMEQWEQTQVELESILET